MITPITEVFEVAAILVRKGYVQSMKSAFVKAVREIEQTGPADVTNWKLYHGAHAFIKDYGLYTEFDYKGGWSGKSWLAPQNVDLLVMLLLFAAEASRTEIPDEIPV